MPTRFARPRRLKLLALLTVLNTALLAIVFLSNTLVAERNWFTTLVAYAPQHLFGLLIPPLVLGALMTRRRRILVANAAVAVLFTALFLGPSVPLTRSSSWDGKAVRVMTYNVHRVERGASEVAAAIKALRPDVLCLQEVSVADDRPDPLTRLRRLLPGWHVARGGDVAVLSRYPIIRFAAHGIPSSTNRKIVMAVTRVGDRDLHVVSLHLSHAATPRSLLAAWPSIPDYVSSSVAVRDQQAAAVLRLCRAVNGPLVIAGDFSTPPRGNLYHRFASRYSNAFRAAGWGTGYTYRDNLALMSIDHIFVSGDVRVSRCFAPEVHASDHRPVVADMLLP